MPRVGIDRLQRQMRCSVSSGLVSWWAMVRAILLFLACAVMSVCERAEDPARVALRLRLTQQAPLSSEDLARFREEVSRSLVDKRVRIRSGAVSSEMTPDQRSAVLGMLTDPAGEYDEGLRQEAGTTFRVLNAPGLSSDSEIEATRRLWVDVETFRPRRFVFASAFPGHGDYAFDLVVE